MKKEVKKIVIKRNEKCKACFNYRLYFNGKAICLNNKKCDNEKENDKNDK
jgi:hypothetical protein